MNMRACLAACSFCLIVFFVTAYFKSARMSLYGGRFVLLLAAVTVYGFFRVRGTSLQPAAGPAALKLFEAGRGADDRRALLPWLNSPTTLKPEPNTKLPILSTRFL